MPWMTDRLTVIPFLAKGFFDVTARRGRLRSPLRKRCRSVAVAVLALAFISVLKAQAAAEDPVAAAEAVIATLSPSESDAARFAVDDGERARFRLTPGRRGGLALNAMDAGTRAATFEFLRATLGPDGAALVDTIIEREAILGRLEGRPGYRDPDLYYLALFGEPGEGRWGFRFEGHHLSLNHAYDGPVLVSVVPFALGANPERHEGEGVPRTVLTGVHEAARDVPAGGPGSGGGAALTAMLERLLIAAPAPFREVYARDLAARLANGDWRLTNGGFRLEGDGIDIEMTGLNRNHIHITVEDNRNDFGGL